MARFGGFDPYKEDRERKAREKAEEARSFQYNKEAAQESYRVNPAKRVFSGLSSRKPRPVSLPVLNLPKSDDDGEA